MPIQLIRRPTLSAPASPALIPLPGVATTGQASAAPSTATTPVTAMRAAPDEARTSAPGLGLGLGRL
ncbi:hypothetical protein [Streptosporangium lutulentum]|uniref:Uncharacterized protein n=1 Tax=Streptosporangium lutulentum TaxID=1461250 RepID=A0ABT9QPM8_9ACTN|nr:hypothetical protein [Streptosporangium lutulentum]MDP9848360.1 hypothetical protein [Streptosporangium lutulentum]